MHEISDSIKRKIKKIQEEYIPHRRIDVRKENEDAAIVLLKQLLGKLSSGQIGKIVDLLDMDFSGGAERAGRFGFLFKGPSRRYITSNNEAKMNLFISEVYGKGNIAEVEALTAELKGVADGFISCLLYLRDRRTHNVLVNATAEGVKAAYPDEPDFEGSFRERYERFNKLANTIRNEAKLEPQEVDIVLTVLPGELAGVQPVRRIEPAEVKYAEPEIDKAKLTHSDVEGILLELGRLLGHKTYVADPSKPYKGRTLGDFATLSLIPEFTYPEILQTVKKVDVIWFGPETPSYPEACFEVEHTTNVTAGLLRLYQLRGLGPRFFIIARSDLKTKFDLEVSKSPFNAIRERYLFRSYDELGEFFRLAERYHTLKTAFL